MAFAFTVIALNNIFFSKAFGASSLIYISSISGGKKLPIGLCLSSLWLMTASVTLTYFTDTLLSAVSFGSYIRIPVYSALLGVIYILTLLILSGIMPSYFDKIKRYIHTAAFNSAVYGSIVTASGMDIDGNKTFVTYMLYGFFAGLSFSVAIIINAAVSEKLESEHLPRSFRGYPANLIFLGFLGMAFYGI
jgi:electron transport complex protein RnfA